MRIFAEKIQAADIGEPDEFLSVTKKRKVELLDLKDFWFCKGNSIGYNERKKIVRS